MKVHKIEILIIDFDGVGAEEITSILENNHYPNHCISPQVKKIESKDIEWSDNHPLNGRTTSDQAYKEIFNE